MNLIIGRKPVLEALRAKENIEHIYVLFGQKSPAIHEIYKSAKQAGVKITEISQVKFNSISSDTNTQGIIAIKSIHHYAEVEEIIENSKKSEYPLILILESIQDPHNLGAILRSAECAGADGVFITKHNSASITETVVKTSAGASEHIPVAVINNINSTISFLKENGFWIVGSHLEAVKNYNEVDYKMPVALILGNEEKGLRHLTSGNCDFHVKIPMKGKIQSLNVSVSAGIFLFEILRQRGISLK